MDDPKHSKLYMQWHEKVSRHFTINTIEIQSVDYLVKKDKNEPLFIKLKADMTDAHGHSFSRIFFLRGASVAILVVLVCEGIEYAVLVNQAQPAIGLATYTGLPAGIVENESVNSAALRELEEETGIIVLPNELIDLCSEFYAGMWEGIYPSPGACDEIIHLYACRKEVGQEVIEQLSGTTTGLPGEQEYITLMVVRLEDVCIQTPDPKTHSAFIMYQSLKKRR